MMSSLLVKCTQCEKVTNIDWCFEDNVTLFCSKCKQCANQFILEPPKQKTDNIITHADFLPCGCSWDAFHFKEKFRSFLKYCLHQKDIKLPILWLNKTNKYKFHKRKCTQPPQECLVQLEDIEKYINTIF